MDALALLCNLHGDGPLTLAALRDIGCEDLVALEGIGDTLLGELLGRDEKAVERFRREARHLHQRLDGEILVPEQESAAAPIQIPTPMPEVEAILEPKPPLVQEPAPKSPEPNADGPVVEAVLELWRSFDRGGRAPDELSDGGFEDSVSLAEVTINGLRASELEALAGVGVLTLADLAEADALSLSGKTGLPYTHLAHLAYLARKLRRKLLGVIPAKAPSQAGPRLAPLDDAAGPFA